MKGDDDKEWKGREGRREEKDDELKKEEKGRKIMMGERQEEKG